MDRGLLEHYLEQGLSLEQIAEMIGRDSSTVGYWVKQYGFVPNGRAKHAARGGISSAQLRPLVEQGLSVRRIATELDVSPSTVRYWLERHGLVTMQTVRRAHLKLARESGLSEVYMDCPRHGETTHFRRTEGGFRCRTCSKEAVTRRRRKVKQILVEEAGGRCAICGYDAHSGALQFHHLDPSKKTFSLSLRGITRSIADLRSEAAKCVLLCGNCHAEVEAGVTELPR